MMYKRKTGRLLLLLLVVTGLAGTSMTVSTIDPETNAADEYIIVNKKDASKNTMNLPADCKIKGRKCYSK